MEGEPSTSRGAGFAELEHIEEELLDYEDEEEVEEVERGHQRAVQKGTLEVSHVATKKAVQRDSPLGGYHQAFVTGNLPRGEKHRTKLCGWPRQSLFSLDSGAFIRALGREAGFFATFWEAIGSGWSQD
ncbi:hypothetical protein NDU88_000663 [Pleurodeles waltl]|uniref:Uncharacterized protein n=1 Tax=Pleurodeles waltl TaxID=8319 RepID=A0AAV7VVE2_PLEWA|nr:hypothetical protein NDU88_000663 [Pleurodeles waltl]